MDDGLKTKPRILLAMPSPFAIVVPFFQSVLGMMMDPELAITPYLPHGTVIHLARHDSLSHIRRSDEWDYLCFLDTDQIVAPLVLRRLVRWMELRPEVSVVAPVIVQRNGDPIPVCYKHLGATPDGFHRYAEQGGAVAAYLSQFEAKWWLSNPSPILPLVPQFPADMAGIPPEIAAGLHDPLYEVDAVGAGMMLLRRDICTALVPDEKTELLATFQTGGEDFDICRRVKAAGGRIFADRGCAVGHLTNWSRGLGELYEFHLERANEAIRKEQEDALLPPVVPDLLNTLEQRAQRNGQSHRTLVAALD